MLTSSPAFSARPSSHRRVFRLCSGAAVLLLFIMPSWAPPLLRAQMIPVTSSSPEVPAAGSADLPAGKLYTESSSSASVLHTSSPAPMAASVPHVSIGAAPVTLPPRPKPVRDLPAPGSGDQPRVRPFRAAAFGLTASTLGPGAEMAVPIASTLNIRFGASYLNVSYPFQTDGLHYDPTLKFTSGRATVDWFPHHGGFHVSAGALYFRNTVAGSAAVVEGGRFVLGGTTYTNTVDDPVSGSASLAYGKRVAPLLLLGFGNLLPRSGRHISVPIEIGGAYMQPPQLNLKLAGTACTNQGCFNAATDPQVQANLRAEISKLQGDLRYLEVYPIVSVGIACRF